MTEKSAHEEQLPPARAGSSLGVSIPSTSYSSENTTSTNGSVSPKLPIARIFSRNRSSSQHSQTKDDSDDHDSKTTESMSLSESERDKKKEKDKTSWQFGKPKGGGGWIPLPFSFTMSHREKNEEIHKIFSQLPSTEKLIDDYSCALQRDILVHGRLYITQNWLCFYANIFAWETLLTIPFQTVISITKERTALLIPNAMQIATTVEKYGFSSFIQRDISYNVVFKVWQNSLLDQPMSPRELVKAARKAWGDSTDVGTEEELWGSAIVDAKSSSPKTHRQQSMPTHVEIGQISATSGSVSLPVGSPRLHPSTSSQSSAAADTTPRGSRKANKPPPLSTIQKSHSAVDPSSSTVSDPPTGDSATPLEGVSPSPSRERTAHQHNAVQTSNEESSTSESLSHRDRRDDGMIQVANSISPSASLTMGVQNSRPLELMDGGKGESGGDSSAEFEAYDFPDQGEVLCGCSEHTGRTILNEIYHGDVETIFSLLFTDSDFYRSFLKARKTSNIEISEWSSQADGTRLRDISYTLSLNYSFGPKYSSCTEHQVYFKNGQLGVKHIVQSDVINGNIPYGDAFYVSCRFCMTRVAHNRTRLLVTSNICFKKNCWGVVKNLIERNAGDGLRSFYGHLDVALKEYLASLPVKRMHRSRRSSRRRHRRQSSVPKEEESAIVRKRRGSFSSRVSKKSSDNTNKASEEDGSSCTSEGKQRPHSQSLPKVNLALTILLGVLVLSNVALYHQLMSYQSLPPVSSSPSFTLPDTQRSKTPAGLSEKMTNWPDSPEEWKSLFKEYWEHEQKEKEQLVTILQGVVDTLKQVENAVSTTRTHLETQMNNINHLTINKNKDD